MLKRRCSMKNSSTSARAVQTRVTDRIRLARLRAGLSKAELARRVGVSLSAAVQWEHPDGTGPSARNLAAVAQCTCVAFEWLATGRGPAHTAQEDGTPAIEPAAIAVTLFEERLLEVFRKLPNHRHEALLDFLVAWTKKPG
jgi:transcriptional regulator with XRE-family HTH domain